MQTGEGRVLRSAGNLIAAATENLTIELMCFGDGILLALSGGPSEQGLISLMRTTQGPGGTVNVTVVAVAIPRPGRVWTPGVTRRWSPGCPSWRRVCCNWPSAKVKVGPTSRSEPACAQCNREPGIRL